MLDVSHAEKIICFCRYCHQRVREGQGDIIREEIQAYTDVMFESCIKYSYSFWVAFHLLFGCPSVHSRAAAWLVRAKRGTRKALQSRGRKFEKTSTFADADAGRLLNSFFILCIWLTLLTVYLIVVAILSQYYRSWLISSRSQGHRLTSDWRLFTLATFLCIVGSK